VCAVGKPYTCEADEITHLVEGLSFCNTAHGCAAVKALVVASPGLLLIH